MTAEAPAAVPTRRVQLDTVTGVRGVLSMTVLGAHMGLEPVFRNTDINYAVVWTLIGFGEAAVSLFFLMSGFLLTWAYRPTDTARAFWRRRVVKIFPNHLVTWVAGLLLMLLAGEFTGVWAVLPSLVLLHVWVPVQEVVAGTNGPAWSLSVELFFYALFPLLLPVVRRIREDRLWHWLFGCGAAIVLVTVVVGLVVPSQPQAEDFPVSVYQFYLLIFVPPVRLLDFVLGMVMARLVLAGRWPTSVRWSWVAAALVLGWVASVTIAPPLGFVAPFVLGNVLLVGKAATCDIEGRASLFSRRWAIWLGDISFAVYLVHWLVLHHGRLLLLGPEPAQLSTPMGILFMIGALVLSLALGHLLHRRVELPAMRRWSRPRSPAGGRSAGQPPVTA